MSAVRRCKPSQQLTVDHVDVVRRSMNVADNLVFLYPNSAEGGADMDAHGRRPLAAFIVSITLSIAEGIPRPPPIESLTVQLKGLETLGVSPKATTRRRQNACADAPF